VLPATKNDVIHTVNQMKTFCTYPLYSWAYILTLCWDQYITKWRNTPCKKLQEYKRQNLTACCQILPPALSLPFLPPFNCVVHFRRVRCCLRTSSHTCTCVLATRARLTTCSSPPPAAPAPQRRFFGSMGPCMCTPTYLLLGAHNRIRLEQIDVCMYVCMYVCTYVCTYVYMCV